MRDPHRQRSRLGRAALLVLLPALSACPTASIYRTARTLNQGEVDVGLLVSATHLEIPRTTTTNSSGFTTTSSATSVTFPNPIPEVSAHYGITDDLEFGGRLALSSLMAEIDLKLRLVGDRNSRTHIAIAPALGYQTLLIIEGPHLTLPVILTQQLTRDLAVNLAIYGGYRNLHVVSSDSSSDLHDFAIDALLVGGSVGLEFRAGRAYFMPVVDVARTVRQFGGASFEPQSYVIVGLSFWAVPNRVVTPVPPSPLTYPPPPPGYPPMYQPGYPPAYPPAPSPP